jgi:hypothetical protein
VKLLQGACVVTCAVMITFPASARRIDSRQNIGLQKYQNNPESARMRAAQQFMARERKWNQKYYGASNPFPYAYYGSPFYPYGWGQACYNYNWSSACNAFRWTYPPYWGNQIY